MSNPIKALNDHFYYNHKMGKALQQFLTPSDRKMIQVWFDKLLQMESSPDEMVIRSDYMWFILLMLQSRKIREPFSMLPPNEVPPLKKFIPIQTYEEVLISNEPNMIYLNQKSDEFLYPKEKVANTTSCSSLRNEW